MDVNANFSVNNVDLEFFGSEEESEPTVSESEMKKMRKSTLPNVSKLPASSSSSKPKPPSSAVWQHFTKIEGTSRCKCKYCGKSYACDSKQNGTSNLWKHLRLKCKTYQAIVNEDKQKVLCFENKKNSSFSGTSSNLVAVGFDKEACRKACTKMIVADELPFKFVEAKGFRYFCSVACPKFDPPSRRTVARDVFQLYLEEKKALKIFCIKNKQRVSITTDSWTSIQNTSYMVVTAHFIDNDWKYQKRILNFFPVPNHKGETIGAIIESSLLEWGIERLCTITVDNASANDVAVNFVRRMIKNWKPDALLMDGQFLHVRCCAHIINLIVNEGLKDIHNSVVCIRNAVRYVRSSPARFQKFKLCAEKAKIEYKGTVCLDVATRWNSTYLMLVSAIQYQRAFERLEEIDGYYFRYFADEDNGRNKNMGPPTKDDWENARYVLRFLKTFYDVTLKFSVSTNVTSNCYFHEVCKIQSQLTKFLQNKDDLLSNMAFKMKNKYDKYWGSVDKMNKIFIISIILDPRCKLGFVTFCFNSLYDATEVELMILEVKALLLQLYDEYKSLDSTFVDDDVFNNTLSEVGKGKGKEACDDIDGDMFCEYRKLIGKKDTNNGSNEVERYLLEPVEDIYNDRFDILSWWKINTPKFKILSLMAKDVFAIPVSTVASESAFSTGGRILDPFRSCLAPKMVEALICTQNWLQYSLFSDQLNDNESCIEDGDEQFESIVTEFVGSSTTLEQVNFD